MLQGGDDQLIDLPLAQQEAGIELVPSLHERIQNDRIAGAGELGELHQGLPLGLDWAGRHANQNGTLPMVGAMQIPTLAGEFILELIDEI